MDKFLVFYLLEIKVDENSLKFKFFFEVCLFVCDYILNSWYIYSLFLGVW